MKKIVALLSKVSIMIFAMIFLLSCTNADASLSFANGSPAETPPDVSPGGENGTPECFADSPLSLKSDAPDAPFFRYDAGASISVNYTMQSLLDADEYTITCSGEGITLLSPAEYSISPSGSYGLQFRAPENGEGSIDITLTAYSDGEAFDWKAYSHLYWSSCGCGVFLSRSGAASKLAMAKAQYDANEITSGDYYDIVQAQGFIADNELMNMLGQVVSHNIEYSHYAAPYVEAVHNSIFGIESTDELPDISQTLSTIREDLGIGSDTPEPSAAESVSLLEVTEVDTPITITGTVTSSYTPSEGLTVEAWDIYEHQNELGDTVIDKNPLAAATVASNGRYTLADARLTDGATARAGGYDIAVIVFAEDPNVKIYEPVSLVGTSLSYDRYGYCPSLFNDIAYNNPFTSDVDINTQDSQDPDYARALNMLHTIRLVAEFAKQKNGGNYFDPVNVFFPFNDSNSSSGSANLFIIEEHYGNKDIIFHEYGHHVSYLLGIKGSYTTPESGHSFTDNFWNDGGSKSNSLTLAWGEAWANFFAESAQGGSADGTYCGGYSYDNPSNTSGEANEGAVVAVLWNLAKVVSFQTLWNLADSHNSKTLDSFVDAFNSHMSKSDNLDLGNILSRYHVSPRLSTPGVTELGEAAPTFVWQEGGCSAHKNNTFNLVFYDVAENEILRHDSIDVATYTLTDAEWDEIIHDNGLTIYWAVEGSETTGDTTGPYLSDHSHFTIPLHVMASTPQWRTVGGETVCQEFYRYCTNVGCTYTQVVSALGHTYANCAATDCSYCDRLNCRPPVPGDQFDSDGHVYDGCEDTTCNRGDFERDALVHSMSVPYWINAAVPTANVCQEYLNYCTREGCDYTLVSNTRGHEYSDCKVGGCSRIGCTYNRGTVPGDQFDSDGHVYDDCEDTTCNRGDFERDALPHSMSVPYWINAASPTANLCQEYLNYCTREGCDYTLVSNTRGHDYLDCKDGDCGRSGCGYNRGTAAGYVQEGGHVYSDYCTDKICNRTTCGFERTAPGHSMSVPYWYNVTSPTSSLCQEYRNYCTREGCDYTLVSNTRGHSYEDCGDSSCDRSGCNYSRGTVGGYLQLGHMYNNYCTATDCNRCTFERTAPGHSYNVPYWYSVGSAGVCQEYRNYCTRTACSNYIVVQTDTSHSYSSWADYSSSQHKRTCSTCKRAEYQSHTYPSSWTYYSSTQHRRACTVSTCRHYVYANHSYSSWTWYSSTQHRRYCSGCGYQYQTHTWVYIPGQGNYCSICHEFQ